MFKKVIWLCLLLILKGDDPLLACEKVNFVVPNFEPYTFEKEGKIEGIGVDFVEDIMKKIGTPFTLELVPNYGRAVSETMTGRADGFFLASENEERNRIAVFSDPIVVNQWCWFLPVSSNLNPKSTGFKETARIGTHLHSNTHKWLKKNDFHISATTKDVDDLINLIEKGRVDAVFLAEIVFLHIAKKKGISSGKYRQVFQAPQPFGIYISKQYLSRNTGFMDKLNQAIEEITK